MSSLDNFHMRVREAYANNRLQIGVNTVKANSPGSPTYRPMDSLLPAVAIVFAIFYGFLISIFAGILAFICGTILFLWLVRQWVMDRVNRRTINYALEAAYPNWVTAWESGLLSLRLAAEPEVVCQSPGEDWQQFVREHLLTKR